MSYTLSPPSRCIIFTAGCQFEPDISQDWLDIMIKDVADSGEPYEVHKFEALVQVIMGDFMGW